MPEPADDFGFDAAPAAESQTTIDWRRYLHAIARRWWLVLLCTVIAVTVAALYTVRQPKQFKATVSMIIDSRTPQVLSEVQDFYESARGVAGGFLFTELEVMRSRTVAGAAGERLGLELLDADHVAAIGPDGPDFAGMVHGRYVVEVDKASSVVRVSVVDSNPKLATDLANAVADAYVELNRGRRVDNTRDASDWLSTQHDELRRKLRASEEGLLKFMADNNVLNASIDSQLDEVKQRLSAFNSQLAIEEASRIRDVLNVQVLEQVRAEPSLMDTMPEMQSAGIINALKSRLIEVRAMEMELSARYLPEHPKMKLVAEQKATLQADLQREVEALLTSMDRSKASRETSISGLKAALAEERGKEARLNMLSIDYQRMRRERDTDAKLFDMVTSRIKEAGLTGAQPFNNARILDRALLPKAPFKPNLQEALLAALIAGLIVGVGVALLLELADTTVKSQSDIEALVDVPFLGLLPLIVVEGSNDRGDKQVDRAAELKAIHERDLFILKNPRSAVAECARFIRTNLLFMSPDRPLRTLVVTSPAPQEGKSTTAVTTAISMAQTGSRTLIVDTDLRKPRLHRVFSVNGDVGISNVLLGEATIEQTIQRTEVPNLDVLVCGALPPNPSEILLSARFKEIVAELAKRYDRVIFDTPPIGPVTDPAILGTLVDGVVLVAKCEKTTKESVKQAMRALKDANARVFGVILNDVDVSSKRYSGAYYAYYRKYGGYYSAEQESPDKAAE